QVQFLEEVGEFLVAAVDVTHGNESSVHAAAILLAFATCEGKQEKTHGAESSPDCHEVLCQRA
ncbi:MAG TPA: hypothetical protein VHD61_16120, partial [Lacunisphaera sp.]|nr:hypothetical protein [Lacunisphaera sp.]